MRRSEPGQRILGVSEDETKKSRCRLLVPCLHVAPLAIRFDVEEQDGSKADESIPPSAGSGASRVVRRVGRHHESGRRSLPRLREVLREGLWRRPIPRYSRH